MRILKGEWPKPRCELLVRDHNVRERFQKLDVGLERHVQRSNQLEEVKVLATPQQIPD
jgi:flavoprotein